MDSLLSFFQLAPAYQLPWHHWVLILLAAFIIGLSKSGLKGVAVVVVTIMALIFGSKSSTGILLPLLITGDIFAVIYYNRHARWDYLFKLLPWMLAGVLIGVWVGKDLPEQFFKRGMAAIILISVAMMYWWDRKKDRKIPDYWWFAGGIGLVAGITTMIGNLAGAFSNIFFLAMRLPKNDFIGTAAWLFFITNLFKLPFHIFAWGTITAESFALNLRLLPGIFLGLWLGVKVVEYIKDYYYRQMILILTAIGALLIFFR